MSVGIPVKLLYEGIGHTVTIEIKSGIVYRGTLDNVEDNMNCLMREVTSTSKDGRVTRLQQVYIRGSYIRFIIFPDMLRHSPMFKLAQGSKGKARLLGLAGMQRASEMRNREAMGNRGGFRGRGRGRGN